jgi:hypothetical protein
MGGVVPLGYRVENRHLVIEPGEARTVQHLFERYLDLRSVRALADEASASGLAGKVSVEDKPAAPFGRGNLYHLLSNPIYVGKIRHRDQLYPGAHQPIVDADLFEWAQALLATQAPARRSPRNTEGQHLLTGLVFDEAGARLRSVHANKKGQRYRYYVSKHMIEERRHGRDGWRLAAGKPGVLEEPERPQLHLREVRHPQRRHRHHSEPARRLHTGDAADYPSFGVNNDRRDEAVGLDPDHQFFDLGFRMSPGFPGGFLQIPDRDVLDRTVGPRILNQPWRSSRIM